MKELRISSLSFDNNGWMPDRCSGYGEDQSPDLKVEGIPEGTVTLAVIMDDLDHPVFREFNHWTAWNIPCISLIPEALPGGTVFHIEQGENTKKPADPIGSAGFSSWFGRECQVRLRREPPISKAVESLTIPDRRYSFPFRIRRRVTTWPGSTSWL